MAPAGEKRKLIVLTGPTAAGKSALSIGLAKALGGEIISADSMQVYRGMDIGTAKISPGEMQEIPHYMIDILNPSESFDVYSFSARAKAVMEDIYSRNKQPIIVGGTGFYIQAVAYDIDFSDKSDEKRRRELFKEAEKNGADSLYERLKSVDAPSAEKIGKNNLKRIIRALEFYESEGYPISEHNKEQRERISPYELYYFVLYRDRQILYEDINRRVDDMVSRGLLEEAKKIFDEGIPEDSTAYKAVGYNELFSYFKGETDLNEAIRLIKQNTRHFAKRQMTWFRREKNVIWIDKDAFEDEEAILGYMIKTAGGDGI